MMFPEFLEAKLPFGTRMQCHTPTAWHVCRTDSPSAELPSLSTWTRLKCTNFKCIKSGSLAAKCTDVFTSSLSEHVCLCKELPAAAGSGTMRAVSETSSTGRPDWSCHWVEHGREDLRSALRVLPESRDYRAPCGAPYIITVIIGTYCTAHIEGWTQVQ